jgi:hypothetical protein
LLIFSGGSSLTSASSKSRTYAPNAMPPWRKGPLRLMIADAAADRAKQQENA